MAGMAPFVPPGAYARSMLAVERASRGSFGLVHGRHELGPAQIDGLRQILTLPLSAIRSALEDLGEPTLEQVALVLTVSVQLLLEGLTALGQAQIIEGGRFAA